MTDIIGDSFVKRKIKGLRGLSFAIYEMGWLDAVKHHEERLAREKSLDELTAESERLGLYK